MARSAKSSRHFVNNFPDFASFEAEFNVPSEKLTELARDLVETITSSVVPKARSCDGGLYVGLAGVAYSCYYVGTKIQDIQGHVLSMAQKYIDVALNYETEFQKKNMRPAFLLGTSGVVATACLICQALGPAPDLTPVERYLKSFVAYSNLCKQRDYLGCGSDEMLVGRAGFLYGAHVLSKKLKAEVLSPSIINTLCQAVVDSGRQYSRARGSTSPLMYAYHGTEYLGAAHGLAGILQALLCYPGFVQSDSSIERDVRGSVDFLLSCQDAEGNIAPATDELESKRPPEHELFHWCHGAPGVIYLFAKAYLTWEDEKYLNACIKCADITWTKGLLKKGPGICHGVAGSGYVFLLMYRLTNDKKYIYQAVKFAEFLSSDEFQRGARTPDCPYSLYEGLAGTLCFIVDLLKPEEAEFPWYDVF